jgi:hypothetical protein
MWDVRREEGCRVGVSLPPPPPLARDSRLRAPWINSLTIGGGERVGDFARSAAAAKSRWRVRRRRL